MSILLSPPEVNNPQRSLCNNILITSHDRRLYIETISRQQSGFDAVAKFPEGMIL